MGLAREKKGAERDFVDLQREAPGGRLCSLTRSQVTGIIYGGISGFAAIWSIKIEVGGVFLCFLVSTFICMHLLARLSYWCRTECGCF